MKIDRNTFIHYTFHSLSQDLSNNQKIFFCFCCAILSIASLGIAPVIYYFTLQNRVKKQENILKKESFVLEKIENIEKQAPFYKRDSIDNWCNQIESLIVEKFLTDQEKELIKNLLLKGKEKGWIDKESNVLDFKDTFLHRLAKLGIHLDFVDVLSEVGADFNHQESVFGNTPLLWAIANGKYPMAEKILSVGLKHRLNVNSKDGLQDNCALSLLIKKGIRNNDLETYKKLLLSLIIHSDLNTQDKEGNTALHLACRRRDWEVVNILLDYGADKDILNKNKQKPIEMIAGNFDQVLEEMGGEMVSTLDRNLFTKKTPKWVYERLLILNEA